MIEVGSRVECIRSHMARFPGWPSMGDHGIVDSAAPDGSMFVVTFDRFRDGVQFPREGREPAFRSRSHKVQCGADDLALLVETLEVA